MIECECGFRDRYFKLRDAAAAVLKEINEPEEGCDCKRCTAVRNLWAQCGVVYE